MAGCGGGSAETASQGNFDMYVPSATPVLRVAAPAAVRVPLQLSESVVVVLGNAMRGNPRRIRIATTDDGKLYAVDTVDGHVRGFDSAGAPIVWTESGAAVLELGRPPLAIGVLGEDLLMSNGYPGQLRLIAASGKIISDVELETSPWKPVGLDDGTFVAAQFETGVLGRYTPDGSEIARYTVFQFPEEDLGGERRLWPHQDFVVGPHRVYVTSAETYRVTAFGIDGDDGWVLEGEVARVRIPEHVSARTLGRSRRAGRAAGATIDTEYANFKWPEYYPALARIATDAQDRLYVFPYVIEENLARYPVDVYDATGAPIVRGWLPFQGWDAFAGDSVYRIETRDGLSVAVRYELAIPELRLDTAAAQ